MSFFIIVCDARLELPHTDTALSFLTLGNTASKRLTIYSETPTRRDTRFHLCSYQPQP